MQLILCILASIGGIFLKIHVSHFTRFRYNNANCDPSVIIGTFLEQQCTPFSESRIPWNGMVLKIYPWSPTYINYMRYKLGYIRTKLRTLNLHNNVSPGCISASSGRIFLKICVLNPTKFQNNRNREFFGLVCDYIGCCFKNHSFISWSYIRMFVTDDANYYINNFDWRPVTLIAYITIQISTGVFK